MPPHRLAEPVLAGRSSRLDGRQDSAAGRMELLVARSARAQLELNGAVARETRMRMAVDETGERTQPPPVELLDVSVEHTEVGHLPHFGDAALLAEDERAFEDVDPPEIGAPKRRLGAGRGHDLVEVADEQPRRRVGRAHSPRVGGIGSSRPCSTAASAASS